MTLSFIRGFFVIISSLVGYYVGTLVDLKSFDSTVEHYPIMGAQIGCVCGLILIFIEGRLRRVSVRGLSSVVFGLLLGIFMAKLISNIISLLPLGDFVLAVSEIVLTLIFSYLGAVMALRGKDEFNIIIPYVRFKRQDVSEGYVLLDTSAIIDGRIYDIYKTGFLSGRLIVARSVLKELQQLADSEDEIKRGKGRRGLDLVHKMQEDSKVEIRVHEDDPTAAPDVDSKLILMAKVMEASICTTDFNLSRVAIVQGIPTLYVPDLASSMKPTVFQGDKISISLVKEGKEHDQAVGYLADGTMVVVSNAKDDIGQTASVEITSILQTQAGRMIFADKAKEGR